MKGMGESEERKQLTFDHTKHVVQLVLAVHQRACMRREAI
jgi:hypothetical protein